MHILYLYLYLYLYPVHAKKVNVHTQLRSTYCAPTILYLQRGNVESPTRMRVVRSYEVEHGVMQCCSVISDPCYNFNTYNEMGSRTVLILYLDISTTLHACRSLQTALESRNTSISLSYSRSDESMECVDSHTSQRPNNVASVSNVIRVIIAK
jgi:hypothetical protein